VKGARPMVPPASNVRGMFQSTRAP
jgi:hypothetical protein